MGHVLQAWWVSDDLDHRAISFHVAECAGMCLSMQESCAVYHMFRAVRHDLRYISPHGLVFFHLVVTAFLGVVVGHIVE